MAQTVGCSCDHFFDDFYLIYILRGFLDAFKQFITLIGEIFGITLLYFEFIHAVKSCQILSLLFNLFLVVGIHAVIDSQANQYHPYQSERKTLLLG